MLLGVAPLVSAAPTDEPRLKTTLLIRDGYLAVNPAATELDLGKRGPMYEACGLSENAVKRELIEYLDRMLLNRGKVLEQIAIGPVGDAKDTHAAALAALRELSKHDQATAKLYDLSSTWPAAEEAFRRWIGAHSLDQPAVTLGTRTIKDVYLPIFTQVPFEDGPLSPAIEGFPWEEDIDTLMRGDAIFDLSPPFGRADKRLRFTDNKYEWEKHRVALEEQLLGPFKCKLWHRGAIIGRVQDYFELRGVSVDAFRTKTEAEKQSAGLSLFTKPEPLYQAGVAPERPRFTQAQGSGRVMLAADPLLDFVFVEADPSREWSTLRRALYLSLATSDWQAVSAAPADYLCLQTLELGRERKMVRLTLTEGPGARLAMADVFFNRRAMDEQNRRLGSIGFKAGMNFSTVHIRRKAASLMLERTGDDAVPTASGIEAPPKIDACGDADGAPREADQNSVPISDGRDEDVVQPARPQVKIAAEDPPRNNHLGLGAEYNPGKPVLWSVGYSRTGLTKNDTFAINIGEQGKPSGNFQYSRDFVGFETFNRRVQLSATAFSKYDPDRDALAPGSNERSNGASVSALGDLWRDRGGTFGQLAANASYRDIDLTSEGASPYTTRLKLLGIDFAFAKSSVGTPASERLDFNASLAWGESSNPRETFAKGGIDLAYNRFVGAFTRWDLRAHARSIGSRAPQVEWPSFGGEDSVRGYRADSAIGLMTWAFQNEIWMSPSALAGDHESLARLLRRSFALAVFADVGGLSDSTNSIKGTKVGAGIGLRYRLNDRLHLRLDWARAIGGDAGTTSGSGHVYLTITSAPFL